MTRHKITKKKATRAPKKSAAKNAKRSRLGRPLRVLDDPPNDLARRFNRLRIHLGLSGEEFGSRIGLSVQRVSHIERGHSSPSRAALLMFEALERRHFPD